MLVAGIVVLLLGVGCAVGYVFTRRKIVHLLSARSTTVGELTSLAKTLSAEVGERGLKEMVALAGEVHCEAPLTSPLGQRRCLFYEMRVIREYEEDREDRDDKGRIRRRTVRGRETISTERQSVDFEVRDGTGSCKILPDGCDLSPLVETVDRFEPGGDRGSIGLGGWRFNVGAVARGRRTLGYRYEEKVFAPLEARVTAIGEVEENGGVLSMGRGGPQFVVSTRSKDELVGTQKTYAKILGVASGVGVAAGIGLTVVGFFSG